MCAACREVSAPLRLVTALRGGYRLVARRNSTTTVAHLYAGALTKTGLVPRHRRVLCNAAVGVLTGLDPDPVRALTDGRRCCRRCMAKVPAAGTPTHPLHAPDLIARDRWVRAYADLTIRDINTAAVWCRTSSEVHQVSRIATGIHGDRPARPRGLAPTRNLPPERQARWDMHDVIDRARKGARRRERTPEEIAATRDAIAAEHHDRTTRERNRRRDARLDRLAERQRGSSYLTKAERDELDGTRR